MKHEIWFVDNNLVAHTICTRKHRTAKCEKPHSAPKEALWTGKRGEYTGDFSEQLRTERRRWRNARKRWATKLRKLATTKVAPGFQEYLNKLIERHKALEPKPQFEWNAESATATVAKYDNERRRRRRRS